MRKHNEPYVTANAASALSYASKSNAIDDKLEYAYSIIKHAAGRGLTSSRIIIAGGNVISMVNRLKDLGYSLSTPDTNCVRLIAW